MKKLKTILTIVLSVLLFITYVPVNTNSVYADDNKAYIVYDGANYYDGDTIIINDTENSIGNYSLDLQPVSTAYSSYQLSLGDNNGFTYAPTLGGSAVSLNGETVWTSSTYTLMVWYASTSSGTQEILIQGKNGDDPWETVATVTVSLNPVEEVNYVAQIVGGAQYTSLVDAINAANADTSSNAITIKLLADLDFSDDEYKAYKWAGSTYNPLRITRSNVTLDLNEKTIFNMGNSALCLGSIYARDGVIENVTIKNGTLLAGTTDNVINSYALLIGGVNNCLVDSITTLGGINNCNNSDVIIKDSTIRGTKYYTVCAQTGADVTIRGTSYTKNTDQTVQTKAMFWVQGAGTDEDLITSSNPTGAFDASIIAIESGYFNVDSNGAFYLGGGLAPTLKGGYYNIDPTAYVADGYAVESVSEEYEGVTYTYHVTAKKVAKIGETQYESFDEAVAAAQAGDTIVLLDDITFGTDRSVPVWGNAGEQPFNIDLNGHTFQTDSEVSIDAGNNGYKASAFCFAFDNEANITVSGGDIKTAFGAGVYVSGENVNLTLEDVDIAQNYPQNVQTTNEYSSAVRITYEGSVEINGGTYGGKNSIAVSNSGGKVVINDGTFYNDIYFSNYTSKSYYDNSRDAVKSITINGGNFLGNFVNPDKGNLVIKGGSFTTDPTAYVAEDYKAVEIEDPIYSYTVVKDVTYVAQIGDVKYETLAAAIAAVPTTGVETTITMIGNEQVVAGVTIANSQNVVLELNGYTVSGNTDSTTTYALITNRGTLTIQDSTDTLSDGTGTGLLTTYISNPDTGDVPGYASNTITNNGALTVKSGKIVNNGSGYACYAIDNQTNGTLYSPVLNIEGGRMEQMNERTYAVRMFCNSTTNFNTLNMSGGVVTGGYGLWLQTPNAKANKAQLTISGGTIGAKDGFALYIGGTKADNSNIQISISGATIDGTGVAIQGPLSGTYGSVKITSGRIYGVQCGANVEKFITGGTYDVEPTAAYIADGYKAVEENEIYRVVPVTYVAQIDNVQYETLTEALNAAQDGNTVKLLKDASESHITFKKAGKYTLDLGGHKFTGRLTFEDGEISIENGTISGGRLDVYDNANVTIAANATFAGKGSGACIVVWGTGTYGQANCMTPELHVYGTATNDGYTAITTNGSDTANPFIYIEEGAVVSSTTSAGIYLPAGTLTVSGGTITGAVGIYFKSTNIEITGGSINATGEAQDYNFNGSGYQLTGDALVIDSCGYPNGIDNVSISGGHFVSANASPVKVYTYQENEPVEKFITGGTYASVSPDAEYIAEGYKAVEENDIYSVVPVTYIAQIGDVQYESLADAIAAVPTDGTQKTITMLKDSTNEGNLAINGNRNIVLDLNDYEVTASFMYVLNGSLVVNNGTLNNSVYVYGLDSDNSGMSSSFTLGSDATIDTTRYGVILSELSGTKAAYDANININGTVSGNVWVMGNIQEGDSVINVSGTVNATGKSSVGIALNGYATLNVSKGASITSQDSTGQGTGIEVRAGSLNVTGGTITGTGAPSSVTPNGSGTTSAASGIAVSTYDLSNISVNITGGIIRAYSPLYLANTVNTTSKDLSISVSGGLFECTNEGTIVVVNNENTPESRAVKFITGGIYNTLPDAKYVADGYKAVYYEENYQVGPVSYEAETNGTIEGTTVPAEITYTVNKVVKEDETASAETMASETSFSVKVSANAVENDTKAVASLGNIKNDATLKAIVEKAVKAAGSAIDANTTSATIEITVAKGAADVVSNKVTYEVHPEALIKVDGVKVASVKIENEDLNGTFTFKLYAGEIASVGDFVKVTHIHSDNTNEPLGEFEVANDGYITISGIESFSNFELEPVETETNVYAKFGYTISLEESINIVFNVKNLTDDLSTYKVVYTDPSTGKIVEKVPTSSTLNSYVIAKCAAKDMTVKYTVDVYHKGEKINNKSKFSIKEYCDTIINGNYSDYAKDLCKATLDYGTEAQNIFDSDATELANGGNAYFNYSSIKMPDYDGTVSGDLDYSLSFSLVTESKTVLNVYFAGPNATTSQVYVNNQEVYPTTINATKACVSIDGINAKDLGTKYTIRIVDSLDNSSLEFKVSPVDYMAFAVGHNSQVLANKAFYNYYLRAVDYFDNKNK